MFRTSPAASYNRDTGIAVVSPPPGGALLWAMGHLLWANAPSVRGSSDLLPPFRAEFSARIRYFPPNIQDTGQEATDATIAADSADSAAAVKAIPEPK